ncbi:MAG: Uma2 family endonuclease [Gemmataceae bacterium]
MPLTIQLEMPDNWAPAPLPDNLPEEDALPLESDWHFLQISLLREVVDWRFRPRNDYYAAGNMFLYYNKEQLKHIDFRGPDFFFVRGVSREPMRRYWAVWEEGGRYPDLIIELLSPTTAEVDRTVKKDVYERIFKTREYFLVDPDKPDLDGFRLGAKQAYEAIEKGDEHRLWSEELGSWLGLWQGMYRGRHATWLRLFDEHGVLWPTQEEEVQRLQARVAELERKD